MMLKQRIFLPKKKVIELELALEPKLEVSLELKDWIYITNFYFYP